MSAVFHGDSSRDLRREHASLQCRMTELLGMNKMATIDLAARDAALRSLTAERDTLSARIEQLEALLRAMETERERLRAGEHAGRSENERRDLEILSLRQQLAAAAAATAAAAARAATQKDDAAAAVDQAHAAALREHDLVEQLATTNAALQSETLAKHALALRCQAQKRELHLAGSELCAVGETLATVRKEESELRRVLEERASELASAAEAHTEAQPRPNTGPIICAATSVTLNSKART